MDTYWLSEAQLVTPSGIVPGAIHVHSGRIRAVGRNTPRRATQRLRLNGAYLAPGFIDLHVWGKPETLSYELVKSGTSAFLTTIGPESPEKLVADTDGHSVSRQLYGAECLGIHLEGPFLNPARGGALPRRWMRRASARELSQLGRCKHIRMMTLAPELPGSLEAMRWCRRNRITVSLGHSEADAKTVLMALEYGACAVTHVFNGMRPFHHRSPSLIDIALADQRLATMVICDGVHISQEAFRVLLRTKGVDHIALVTDSIMHQGLDVIKRNGAYYTRNGTLAGSCLTMMQAIHNAVKFGRICIADAVKMATEVPARLLGIERSYGALAVGRRADLVAFSENFRVLLTMVSGRIVYQRKEN